MPPDASIFAMTDAEEAVLRRLIESVRTNLIVRRFDEGALTDVWVGQGIENICDYSADEIEAEPRLWSEIIHPDDTRRVTDCIDLLISGEIAECEYRIFRKDGQMRWVRESCAPCLDENGEVSTCIGWIADITPDRPTPLQSIEVKKLLDETPTAVSIRDSELRLIYCNRAYLDFYGVESAQQLVDMRLADLMSLEWRDVFESRVRSALLAGPWSGELRLVRMNGEPRDVQVSTNVIRDERGRPKAVYAMLTDITERKRAEEALLANNALLKLFVEHTPAAVAMFDKDMRYIMISRRWLTDYKLGDPDIAGRSHYEVFPDVPQRWKDIHQRVLQGETIRNDEDVFVRADGATEYIRWELRPWRDDSGEIGGLVMFTEVITDRKLSESALRESEEKYRSLTDDVLDVSEVGVFILDAEFRIVWINRAMQSYYGIRRERVTGADKKRLIESHIKYIFEDPEDFSHRVLATYENNSATANFICHVLAGPGREERWLEHRSQPITSGFYAGGRVEYYTDITTQHRASEEIRESNAKYQAIVAAFDGIVYICNSDYTIEFANRALVERTGRDPTGERCYKALHDIDYPCPWCVNERVQAGETVRWEVRSPKDDRWYYVVNTPIPRADGSTSKMAVIQDVTDRKLASERAEKHARRMAALAEISTAFVSSLDTASIVQAATTRTAETIECECSVFTIDPRDQTLHHISIAHQDPAISQRVDNALEQTLLTVDQAFGPEGIRAATNSDLRHLGPDVEHFADLAGIGPYIVVPIYSEGEFFGVLGGGRPEGEPEFDDDDLWFFTEVAAHASAALTNSALFERQSRIAATLQHSLIPSAPVVDALDVATRYIPAAGEAEVGGDFFDFVQFPGYRIGLVVGDVSGKGIEAAVHTAEAKYMLRAFAHQDPDPGHVITALNEALCAYTADYTFITLFYALIDVDAGKLLYVNAGHEPPILLNRNTGGVASIEPNGPICGISENHVYHASEALLRDSEILLCYTDGVTDTPSDGERFGFERLVETAATSRAKSAVELLECVIAAITDFGKGVRSDDQVIVTARPTGPSPWSDQLRV